MKKLLLLFVVAFVLNAAWENAHSFLYASYQGGTITEFILLRATLADAAMIAAMAAPFLFFTPLKKRGWMLLPVGFVLAVGIERWALATGRWVYAPAMPIIPLLSVGLTPALQLGVLGYLSFKIAGYTERWV